MSRVNFENLIIAIGQIANLVRQSPVTTPEPGIGAVAHNGFVRPAR